MQLHNFAKVSRFNIMLKVGNHDYLGHFTIMFKLSHVVVGIICICHLCDFSHDYEYMTSNHLEKGCTSCLVGLV
jgi:hypothetical protein